MSVKLKVNINTVDVLKLLIASIKFHIANSSFILSFYSLMLVNASINLNGFIKARKYFSDFYDLNVIYIHTVIKNIKLLFNFDFVSLKNKNIFNISFRLI